MKGDIKSLLDFFELVGHVESVKNYDEKYEMQYMIKLIPGESEISVFELNKLQTIVAPNDVSIWFYHNSDTDENECNIEIKILRQSQQ